MIDKIFKMLLKEAMSRPGKDLSSKLFLVCTELHIKLLDKFEELNPDWWVLLPDDPEELASGKSTAKEKEVSKSDGR